MRSFAPHQTGQLRRPTTRIPTVCVVGSKADDYQGWEALAEAKGAKLQIVANAEEALRLARTAAVDLWVVNTELPGLSGYELCRMLKLHSPSAAVYMVSDEYTTDQELQARCAGATLYACKPGHGDLLAQWLSTHRAVCHD